MMEAELTEQTGYGKSESGEKAASNRRNGKTSKTLRMDQGPMESETILSTFACRNGANSFAALAVKSLPDGYQRVQNRFAVDTRVTPLLFASMRGFEPHPVSLLFYFAFAGQDMDGVFPPVSGLSGESAKDCGFNLLLCPLVLFRGNPGKPLFFLQIEHHTRSGIR